MLWEGNRRGGRSKVGLKLGGFKGEASAQALGPWDRGCLWASSGIPGETDPSLPRLLAPYPAGKGGLGRCQMPYTRCTPP